MLSQLQKLHSVAEATQVPWWFVESVACCSLAVHYPLDALPLLWWLVDPVEPEEEK